MRSLARNTLFREILELAQLHGVSPETILSEIDLDPVLALQPGAMVPASKLVDAVEFASAATGRADFGLLLGGRNDHRSLGPVGVLAQHCKTVVEAVAEGSRYLHLHNSALVYALESKGSQYQFRVQVNAYGRFVPKQYIEAILCMFVRFCRLVIGNEWSPLAVLLQHERLGPRRAYAAALGNAVRFQQDVNAVIATAADMERPIVSADHRIKTLVTRMLDEIEQDQEGDFAAEVAAVVRPLLSSGRASMSTVTALMQIPERTLQRRLGSQGTTFRKILTDLRVEVAERQLASSVPLSEIAGAIGLSEASAVSRFLRSKSREQRRSATATARSSRGRLKKRHGKT